MIKEAIDRVLELASIKKEQIGQQIFSNQPLKLIPECTADTLGVRNLSGVVDYLKHNFDSKLPVIIHVQSPTDVSVVTGFNRDLSRSTLVSAKALLPEIPFGRYIDMENFNILLQSCFVDDLNTQRATVLQVVGNVRDEQVMTFGDDGVSQQVTAKTGIATSEIVPVPNPVHLKPFRTFVEIEQPVSAFILRMQKGPSAALFEADGGAWKIVAIESIKAYFHSMLAEQIDAGQIVIVG